MKIKVNNKETELTQGNNVASLAQQLELPQQGVAVAINNRMIPRSQWAEQEINLSLISQNSILIWIRHVWLLKAVADGFNCA